MSDDLYWSKRGEVACRLHAPSRDSDRWNREHWTSIDRHGGPERVRFQCQHCAEGPIAHARQETNGNGAQRSQPRLVMREGQKGETSSAEPATRTPTVLRAPAPNLGLPPYRR